jgi:hypothetical protein
LPISQHGAGAVSEATRLAGRMIERANAEGWQVWARIRLAIEALQGSAARRAELKRRAVRWDATGCNSLRQHSPQTGAQGWQLGWEERLIRP